VVVEARSEGPGYPRSPNARLVPPRAGHHRSPGPMPNPSAPPRPPPGARPSGERAASG
jgi:hypothetical protein